MVLPISHGERELLVKVKIETCKIRFVRIRTLCSGAKVSLRSRQIWELSGGIRGQGEEQPSGLLGVEFGQWSEIYILR